MVQIDIPAAFVASMFFIDLGRERLKKEVRENEGTRTSAYYQYLFRSVFFAAFVIGPAGLYLLAGWPGWEQIYWSRRFEELIHTGWANALLPTAFLMAIVLAGYGGHVLGYRWLLSGKERYLRPTYLTILVVVAAVVLACYPSFLLVGTYDQYHNLNGQTRAAMSYVWRNPYDFSIGWLGVMVYFTGAFIYLVLRIRRENQRGTGEYRESLTRGNPMISGG
jgi:hypothetical protein